MQAAYAPASAQMTTGQRFEALGAVIVWAADATGQAPVASDFILDTGTGNSAASSGDIDLIGTDVHTVVTGTLAPAAIRAEGQPIQITGAGGFLTDRQPNGVLDTQDTFEAFRLRGSNGIETTRAEIFSSFFIASNTAFSIDAQATPIGATTDNEFGRIRLQFRMTENGNDGLAFGTSAQIPHTGNTTASGTSSNNRSLNDFTAPRRIFAGNRRTARLPGTIAQQSVRFDSRYRYNDGNYELSDGKIDAQAEVIFTVYIP